jgi:transcription-repair coupling factor (superfamily II helicase)
VQNQEIISYNELIEQLTERKHSIDCIGFSGSEKAYLIAKFFLQQRVPLLVVASSTKQAEQLIEDLRFFAGNAEMPILFFPPYNILPFKFLSYHNETAGHRIRVLYQLLEETTPSVLVTTIEALLQKLIPRYEISRYAELVIAGEEVERDYLVSKLISGGYVKTAIVEEPGDFSIRGGIIDIFSSLYPDPLRIEFYGDLVESLRFFFGSKSAAI